MKMGNTVIERKKERNGNRKILMIKRKCRP